jgi:RimJ/RimL family protein N-acetyltransferase
MARGVQEGADGGWLVSRPPEHLETVGPGSWALSRACRADVGAIVTAVNQSLEHLRPWMVWAREPATERSIGEFVDRAETHWPAGREFEYVIRSTTDAPVVGGCGLLVRNGPGVLEIGYWIHVDHLRRGVASAVAAALTGTAFALPEVHRVEIKCDPTNRASAGVPAKLGYRQVTAGAPDGSPMVWAMDRAEYSCRFGPSGSSLS